MPATPKRYARKQNKATSTRDLTSFASVNQSSTHRGIIDHICDSAFLAERGIFNCVDSQKHPKSTGHQRSGQAA